MSPSSPLNHSPPVSTPAVGMVPAVVLEVDASEARVQARSVAGGSPGELLAARVAVAGGYEPSVGDRVLLLRDEEAAYVVGVLHAARPTRFELSDGSTVTLQDGALELRDADDGLLLRYAGGAAEVRAPQGDLTLSAPCGRVRLHSGLDVEIEADRDVVQRACRDLHQAARRRAAIEVGDDGKTQLGLGADGAELATEQLSIRASDTRIASGRLSVVAHDVAQTVQRFAANVERYELVADRVVERSRTALRDVAELFQSRAGKARHVVASTFSLRSRRTTLRSRRNTSIDGSKILLG